MTDAAAPLPAPDAAGAAAAPEQGVVLGYAPPQSPAPAARFSRGVLALADQGLVSAGNFATNIILARQLVLADYGAYSFILEIALFLTLLHQALVIYPLSVRGAVADAAGLRRTAFACLLFTAALLVPLSLGLGLASGLATSSLQVAGAAVAALALWLVQETMRRALMSHLRYGAAIAGDVIRFLGQPLVLLALHLTGQLTVASALLTIGISSLLAAAVQALLIGIQPIARADLVALAGQFWKLGGWMMLGNLTGLVSMVGCAWLMAYAHGMEEVGRLRALGSLVNLINPVMSGMVGLILPAVARVAMEGGLPAARRVTIRYGGVGAAMVFFFLAVLCLFPGTVLGLLYGWGSPLVELTFELRLFALYGALMYSSAVVGALLEGLEKSRHSFFAKALQTVLAVVVTMPLIAWLGVDGAIYGGIIGLLALTAAFLHFIRHAHLQDERQITP